VFCGFGCTCLRSFSLSAICFHMSSRFSIIIVTIITIIIIIIIIIIVVVDITITTIT
jgi:hypothetical protein